MQERGDRGRKKGGAPKRRAYAPCSPVLKFSSQPRRRTARRVARRRSLARAQRVGMCVLARRCVRRKEEKMCAGQRGTEVRNKKEAARVLARLGYEKRYCSCSCGRATAPASLALYQKKKPCSSSQVSCKEGSVGACACAHCFASAGGGVWQWRCDDSAVGTVALERLR